MYNNSIIDIVIPTDGNESLLTKCIDALEYQTYDMSHINVYTVFDNVEPIYFTGRSFKITPVASFAQPSGVAHRAATRNRGVEHITKPYVLFLDQDIILEPHYIELLLDLLIEQNKPSVTIGCVYDIPPDELDKAATASDLFESEDSFMNKLTLTQSKIQGLKDNLSWNLTWQVVSSGNLCVPVSQFLESGGFNEEYIGYGEEDVEFGYRLQERCKLPIASTSLLRGGHMQRKHDWDKRKQEWRYNYEITKRNYKPDSPLFTKRKSIINFLYK